MKVETYLRMAAAVCVSARLDANQRTHTATPPNLETYCQRMKARYYAA
ncbi:MAG: hypothetical protein ABL891_18290 [Burkholderiales bacterium]